MNPEPSHALTPSREPKLNAFEVWKEYEKIAMHFNDLLMKLRTQSLGGVAAIATLAGIVAKTDLTPALRWGVMASAFLLLNAFWLAVWILDFCYYNRLLNGAVDALVEIEAASKTSATLDQLNLSTRIEEVVGTQRRARSSSGRWWFYSIVSFALIAGFIFSLVEFMRGR
jgi:hypothetical protein